VIWHWAVAWGGRHVSTLRVPDLGKATNSGSTMLSIACAALSGHMASRLIIHL
jgi:hypothetical protein